MTDRKKRAGQYPRTSVKGSNFLPKTFQTPTNKKWLDSTLDQMISKSDLAYYNGYIGSTHGKVRSYNDSYIQTPASNEARDRVQLQPGIVTRDAKDDIGFAITFDDIANGVNSYFDTYNYNAAYASQPYVYNPPINIDKFLNFSNYYWVQNMPVYTSVKQSGSTDIIAEVTGESRYQVVDDNNTYDLYNGMVIKFDGIWGPASGNTYIVQGVGTSIRLRLLQDSNGKINWTNRFRNHAVTDGYWDNTQVHNIEPNTSSKYWNQTYGPSNSNWPTPLEMLTAYEADQSATKPVLFDGFVIDHYESNHNLLTESIFAKFTSNWETNWTQEDQNKIYFLEHVTKNDINPQLVVDASLDASNNIVTTVIDQALLDLIGLSFDSQDWDATPYMQTEADYFVINSVDEKQTAWSRNNMWVHVNALKQLKELVPSINYDSYVNFDCKAKRPIIEFESQMNMWNGQQYQAPAKWHGLVDFIVDPDGLTITPSGTDLNVTFDNDIPLNSVVAFTDTYVTHTYIKTATGVLSQHVEINEEDTALVIGNIQDSLSDYVNSDICFRDNAWFVTQEKFKVNQPPLFRLFNKDGLAIEMWDTSFSGCQIFGYKPGTGEPDAILNTPLSYKDSVKGAEYEFQNFIFTTQYSYSVTDSIDTRLSWQQDITGYYFFEQSNVLKTVYVPSDVAYGAFEHVNYEVEDIVNNFEIPYGYESFLPVEEFLVYKRDGIVNLLQATTNGVDLRKKTTSADSGIITQNFAEIEFHNLVEGTQLKFFDDGISIEDAAYTGPLTVTRTATSTELSIGNVVGTGLKPEGHTINVFLDDNLVVKVFNIFVVESILNRYHRLYVNGKPLDTSSYTVDANSISIDQSVLNQNDIIDFEFFNNDNSNSTLNTSLPELHAKNSTNERLDTFTISETLAHWQDILVSTPSFEGDAYGVNNYDRITRFTTFGGTIFLHEDNSIMHDIQYTDGSLSITGALVEQGTDYDAFVTRFRNQVKRLYATKSYDTIHAIVQDALNAVVGNRKGTELYKYSNMVYPHKGTTETVQLDANQTEHLMTYVANGDENIRDHVYVWLSSDHNNDDTYYRKILVPNVDYTVSGKKITLLNTPIIPSNNKLPVLEVQYHQMDEECFVPQSMVKLGLQFGTQPQVVDNKLYTHDCNSYELASSADLFNMTSANFDVVNAAQYELEIMIFAGLVNTDNLYSDDALNKYKTTSVYMPSQHTSTWYTLSKLDTYVHPYLSKWARLHGISGLIEDNIYDENDPTTWNYKDMTSSILGSYDKHLQGDLLPGHYTGIYEIIFGTCLPHINPWHMLGFAFKPSWWDASYAFGDATRFANLKTALRTGLVSDPTSTAVTHNPKYARYAWDWDNKCPFDQSGDMVSPELVLGTPSNVEAAKPFVYGDYGPTERLFRNSNLGRAALIDAICKVIPAKSYTDFFQPGVIVDDEDKAIRIDKHVGEVIKPNTFKIPGKVYGNTLYNIEVIETNTFPTSNVTFDIFGNEDGCITSAHIYFEDNQANSNVESIALSHRLDNIKDEVVIKSNELDSTIELKYDYKQVEYVANGISQAQYNYMLRNGFSTNIEDIYPKLDTQLMQKASGFTRKESVEFIAESSPTGAFRISANDYDIVMYRGFPTQLATASVVKIKRVLEGYQISGISTGMQEFKFFEPDMSISSPYTSIEVGGVTVRRHNKFATTPSIAEFGTVLSRIQDVYDFVRGYFAYLETTGYTLQYNYDAQANVFVKWAIRSVEGDTTTLTLGNKFEFTSSHGHVYEYNKLCYHSNDFLAENGFVIDKEDIVVTREGNTVTAETKSGSQIGSVTTAVLDYEHAFVFNNVTSMGNILINKLTSARQERLLARGGVTQDWDGNKRAPGYLVFDDHIVQNFDSTVQEINDFYRTDVTEFNSDITHAKNMTIGNIEREWLNQLNLDPNVVARFYQGAIKEAGTNVSIDRLARFIKGATDISMYEEYMFNNAYFGDTTRKSSTEIKVLQKEINNNPQVFEFAEQKSIQSSINIVDNDPRIVNENGKEFAIEDFASSTTKLLTAGEPLADEARYTSFNMQGIKDVWDNTADYALIDAWVDNKSYVMGDVIRHKSQLYKCTVNATGLTNVITGIDETGTRTNPSFPYGTVASIAGESITLTNTGLSYNDIVATGSVVSPSVNNLDTLTIDGETVTFRGTTQSQVVVGDATLIGNIINPYFSSVAGKAITINGTLIDFDNTPADQFYNDVFQATVDTYTITSPTLSPSTYFVSSVNVAGNDQTGNYTISGQDVIFTDISTFVVGDAIQVVMEHVDNGMTTTEILNTINGAGITGLSASLSAQSTLQLDFTSANTNDQLVVSPGATNADLGFDTAGEVVDVVVGFAYLPLTMAEIVDQINEHTGFVNIIASNNSNQLQITKPSATSNLRFGAGANAMFGFVEDTVDPNAYPYTTSTVNTYVDMILATQQINNHMANENITDIVASVSSGRIRISSSRTTLDFGNTEFNDLSGLPTGIIDNLTTNIVNTFNYFGEGDPNNEWKLIDNANDPQLFSVWVVNDSDYTVQQVDSVKSKFNDWNMFNVQNHGLYTYDGFDDDGCGICAGTATTDGNDAQITTQSAHNLNAGDYVLLTNTTTSPSIDGVHMVTQVHPSNNKIFYIDQFIESCGNASSVMVLRNQRFENNTQRDLAETSTRYFIADQSLTFSSYNDLQQRSTNVYTKTGEATFADHRFTNYRVLNNDVENIIVYDYNTNTQLVQLELFDPLRGIIPGIAQKEIDITSLVDTAAYNATNDENYNTVDSTYWAQEQVGKRWWDTSTVRYYDYDQSDYSYQSRFWGKVFPGSSIDVYEWTKSTVSPEEYNDAVADKITMFGVLATGEAYSVYNSTLQENIYYYSETQEWNAELGIDETVYYFWVKNKDTRADNRQLTNKAVADIIYNPTANGIAWFAAITPVTTGEETVHTHSNAFIVANSDIYFNDTSSVMQINLLPDGINHNSWMTIARDKDMIPDYYYIGMRNNLATIDANDENLPNYYIHEYNRIGDDRTLKQTWFMDRVAARNEARVVVNELLKDINLYKDYNSTWNRTFVARSMPAKTWTWTSYVSDNRNPYLQPTIEIEQFADLQFVDTALHQAAVLEIITPGDMLDRSEIYEYINGAWELTEKKNSTIELLDIVSKDRASWDNFGWDSTTWDSTQTADWWRTIVDAARNDWFISVNKVKFNTFFFAMIDFVLAEQSQPNWVHKSTYIKVDISHDINTSIRRYTRDTVSSIIGYINTVKPFHTKVKDIVDIQETNEELDITIEESNQKHITLQYNDFTNSFVGTILDSGNNWETEDIVTIGGDDWSYQEEYDNGVFHQPHLYANTNNNTRQHLLDVLFGSSVKITVQTNTSGNTVDTDTRTFVMFEGSQHTNPVIVGLEDNKSTTLTTAYTHNSPRLVCDNVTDFGDRGYAYVNGEIIEYKRDGSELIVTRREMFGTLGTGHPVGSLVVCITDAILNTSSRGTIMLNDAGSSILTSTDSITADELQNLTQGISL